MNINNNIQPVQPQPAVEVTEVNTVSLEQLAGVGVLPPSSTEQLDSDKQGEGDKPAVEAKSEQVKANEVIVADKSYQANGAIKSGNAEVGTLIDVVV